jgi:hypothetical protein
VKVSIGGDLEHHVAEGHGPVDALNRALRKALKKAYPQLDTMELVDYKVRVVNSKAATAARGRVVIESRDQDAVWGTVGVSENIIEASWCRSRTRVLRRPLLFKDEVLLRKQRGTTGGDRTPKNTTPAKPKRWLTRRSTVVSQPGRPRPAFPTIAIPPPNVTGLYMATPSTTRCKTYHSWPWRATASGSGTDHAGQHPGRGRAASLPREKKTRRDLAATLSKASGPERNTEPHPARLANRLLIRTGTTRLTMDETEPGRSATFFNCSGRLDLPWQTPVNWTPAPDLCRRRQMDRRRGSF